MQYPDDWLHPTQATKIKQIVDITSDSTGYFAYAIGWGLLNAVRTYTVAAGAWTAANVATDHPDRAAYIAAFSRSRFLCSGLRYTPTQTPEKSSGSIGFLTTPEEGISSYTGVTLATMFTDCTATSVHEPRVEHKYNYGPPAFRSDHIYYDTAPTMLVIGRGCLASTSVGVLEIFWNLEGVSNPASVHAGASKTSAYDPESIRVATHVQQNATVSTGYSPRRLTATGRQVADLSAALAGVYLGGAPGALLARAPTAVRSVRKAVRVNQQDPQKKKRKGRKKP